MRTIALLRVTTGMTLVLTLGACNSGHLSRPNAKAQLERMAKRAQLENPEGPHSLLVRIGTVANCEPSPSLPDYDPVDRSHATAVLSATGYLTVLPIKKHVWDVELTELGKRSVSGKKYGHEQKGNCDEWQVTIPLSKYDHLDVTGIVEDGVHAKVDASLTFVILPVGLAVRTVAPAAILTADTKTYGEKFAQNFLNHSLTVLLGDDLVDTPPDKDRYVKEATFAFDKYDDGWKLSTQAK